MSKHYTISLIPFYTLIPTKINKGLKKQGGCLPTSSKCNASYPTTLMSIHAGLEHS